MTPRLSLLKLLLLASISHFEIHAAQEPSSPLTIFPAVISSSGECPSSETAQLIRDVLKTKISTILSDQVPNCPCSGERGPWTKIADYNFSDSNVSCPTGFHLVSTPVRGCGRPLNSLGGCNAVSFSVKGRAYSHVCGRINGYQKGEPDAFKPSFARPAGLEGGYLDGVSLTHGVPGSRKHIWSFAASNFVTDPNLATRSTSNCPCMNSNWIYSLPSFVGEDYFCATGNAGPVADASAVYSDDPLWDGKGCGLTNACCQFNSPPWFCTTLAQPSLDDIEMRVCLDSNQQNEDVILSIVEIYIK